MKFVLGLGLISLTWGVFKALEPLGKLGGLGHRYWYYYYIMLMLMWAILILILMWPVLIYIDVADIDISFPKPAPESLSCTIHKRPPLHLLCTTPDIDIVARWCTLHLLCTPPGNKLFRWEMKNWEWMSKTYKTLDQVYSAWLY